MRQAVAIIGLWLVVAQAAVAGEIKLHSLAEPTGAVIRLGDIAELSGLEAAARTQLAGTPLMPALPQGARSFIRQNELRDLLAARGVDVAALRFAGAEAVEIRSKVEVRPQPRIAPKQAPDHAAVAADLESAVVAYLRKQTGHDLWMVDVEADEPLPASFGTPGVQFQVGGGKAPWTGRQRFYLSTNADADPVVATARVERHEMTVVPVQPIKKGDLVRQSDVELRPYAGALPRQAAAALDQVVGKEAVQNLRAEAPLALNQLRSPVIVRRGERVSVRVVAAGVAVKTFGTAQQDGGLGELVTVQSLASKDTFAARVSGLGELEIMAGGAVAADLSTPLR